MELLLESVRKPVSAPIHPNKWPLGWSNHYVHIDSRECACLINGKSTSKVKLENGTRGTMSACLPRSAALTSTDDAIAALPTVKPWILF